MKKQKTVWLFLGLILFVNVAFADLPGGGVRWPAQKIRFSNVHSLGNFVLHVNYEYDNKEDSFYMDKTFYFPEHGGSPGHCLKSFFAISGNISTDTVKIKRTDKDFYFTGIKNNKLQFSRKIKKGTVLPVGVDDNADYGVYRIENSFLIGKDKSLVLLSISAIVCLLFLFGYYKKQEFLNTSSITG